MSNYHLELVNVYALKMRDQNNLYIDLEDRRKSENVGGKRSSINIDKRQKHPINDDNNKLMHNQISLTKMINLLSCNQCHLTVHIKDNNLITITPHSIILLIVIQRPTGIQKKPINNLHKCGCIKLHQVRVNNIYEQ